MFFTSTPTRPQLYRVTADLDFKNKFKLLFYLYRVMKTNFYSFHVQKSNSKGFHLIVWYENLTIKKAMQLRKYFGDDKRRLIKDKIRRKPKQYLFFKKLKIRT